MIKQLFNVKLLGAVLLSTFMLVVAANFSSLQAQHTDGVQEFQSVPDADLDQLKAQLKSIIEDVENNNNYTDPQKHARFKMYDHVWIYAKEGVELETSITYSINITTEYVRSLHDPSSVDLEAILQEAKNNLL